MFDVSDVANPTEIDKYVLGDRSGDSIAINEHKALLFSKDKNLLVIPVSMQGDIVEITEIKEGIISEENPRIAPPTRKYFNGAAVFNVNKKGFELKGKIDHAENDTAKNYYNYQSNVQRSLYINDVLYTLSNKYLKANWLDTLKEVKNLKISLADNNNPTPIPIPMPRIESWK